MFCAVVGSGFTAEAVAENLGRRYDLHRISAPEYLRLSSDDSGNDLNFDSATGQATIRRDRLGQKVFYYHVDGRRLYIADRLDLLVQLTGKTAVSPSALSDFLSLGYVPAPDTIYAGISVLPPAHQLDFNCRKGDLTVARYWDFPLPDASMTWGDAQEILRSLLTSAVENLLNRKNCGLFLSGGVDSAVVGAIAAKLGAKLPAFTIGFDDPIYDEHLIAERSAKFIGCRNWQCKMLAPGTFSAAAEHVLHSGEPLGDASLWATRQLCLWAGKSVSFGLTGDGADELLGGYDRYRAMTIGRKVLHLPAWLRRALRELGEWLPGQGERSLKMRSRRFWSGLQDSEAETYFSYLDRFPAPRQAQLLATMPASASRHFNLLADLPGDSAAERCSRLDWYTYLPGDALAKSRLAATGSGLEIASPFLSAEVADFCAALPWCFKQSGAVRKKLLKAAFASELPPELLRGRKRGFGVPIARFLRAEWRDEVRYELLDGPLGDLGLSRLGLEALWLEHVDNRADNSYLLWHLAVLSGYLRRQRA